MVAWSNADMELVREILREAEAYLQSQLSLALAADQRASVMASFFAAAAAAIVAGMITLASAAETTHPLAIYAGGAVSAALLVKGAALCIWAAHPVGFAVPGNEPKNWYEDVAKRHDLKVLLGEQAEHYQTMIQDNNTTLRTNSRRFVAGAIAGIAAPVAGCIAWAAVRTLAQ